MIITLDVTTVYGEDGDTVRSVHRWQHLRRVLLQAEFPQELVLFVEVGEVLLLHPVLQLLFRQLHLWRYLQCTIIKTMALFTCGAISSVKSLKPWPYSPVALSTVQNH